MQRPIYRRYIDKKSQQNFSHARVTPNADMSTDISAIFRRNFPIFFDFSFKRNSIAKIASIKTDIRYIDRYIGNFNPWMVGACFAWGAGVAACRVGFSSLKVALVVKKGANCF